MKKDSPLQKISVSEPVEDAINGYRESADPLGSYTGITNGGTRPRSTIGKLYDDYVTDIQGQKKPNRKKGQGYDNVKIGSYETAADTIIDGESQESFPVQDADDL